MNDNYSRKNFIRQLAFGTGGLMLFSHLATGQQPDPNPKGKKDKGPALSPELVKEFVGACHGKFDRAQELLKETPGLLNCSWDWGGGDFETGLEGAGHAGNKEIANFLLANGARMNIFCAAMLGKIEIVKSILTAFPDLKTSKGPHGLMLLHHARKGGEEAKEVLQYLEEIGAT